MSDERANIKKKNKTALNNVTVNHPHSLTPPAQSRTVQIDSFQLGDLYIKKLLAALKNEDLREVDRLLDLKQGENLFFLSLYLVEILAEVCRAGLESCVVKWIMSTTNLDPETSQTLLEPFIMSGSIESVEALLIRGADLNLHCSSRRNVLVIALWFLKEIDRRKMVKFLVEKGANVNRSHSTYSPLVAATMKQTDVVSYLLQKGADVNEVGDNRGNTPLTAALYYGECRSSTRCCSIIETLLSAGADPNKPNKKGETALHLADDTEISSLLIQAGADLEARNDLGRTPLLVAASSDRTDVIKVLKNYGADMAAVDNKGNSALHLMVKESDEPREETLRLFAFQCNQINYNGMTPLMLAAWRRCTKAVRFLLDLGADPNIVKYESREPQTALSVLLDKIYGTSFGQVDELLLACTEKLITRNSMTGLPRCSCYFFKMIFLDQRRLVQIMVTHGMAPLCENTRTISRIDDISSVRLRDILGKLSPLAAALVSNRLAIAQYLTENWFLTPADLVGSLKLRHLRSRLEWQFQDDGLRFMDENLSQPMSLLKLSFVAVSAQLGGVAGREERVNQTPLPNILKDKLLFRRENFPMDLTD
ncbi:ankyrin [Plakobranchus ocellatus]|uniref:Ankyrin n=1 Tax=Plakobranchus ocellatus TaxID=259542 RepID=A0AAV3Y3F5_9GAST|nr:ankyrin [Plakobranchus ocellatus]